jgi:hypothetical protein
MKKSRNQTDLTAKNAEITKKEIERSRPHIFVIFAFFAVKKSSRSTTSASYA